MCKKLVQGRVIAAAVYLISVLCLPACAPHRESAPGINSSNKQTQTQGASQAGGTAPSDKTRFFRGTIGDNYKIEMKLVRAGERLSGTYAYQKVGTDIELKGTIDGKGNFTLQEFDSRGGQTGVFKGTWSEPETEAGAALQGNWSKTNGGEEELAFYLTEQNISFGGGLKVVARSIKEEDKNYKYSLNVEYPQIEGSSDPHVEQFNKEVSAQVKKDIDEWKQSAGRDPKEEDDSPETGGDDLTMSYDVTLATDSLASVRFQMSTYEHGAAHPLGYSKVINYDLKDGRSLKLADLFQPQADYLQTIASYCINDLKRRSRQAKTDEMTLEDKDIEEGASAKADNYQSWNITPKGLLITFDAYQVGPYALGPQQVVVPFAALREIIRPDGPLVQFVK
jgi:hypothetical protein